MRLLKAIRRWYRETRRGAFDWYSAPRRRGSFAFMTAGPGKSRGPRPDAAEILIPDFSNPDDFSPALYANLCAFDVEDLGFHIRLGGWGRAGRDKMAPFNHFRLEYAFPNFGGPAKVMELNQGAYSWPQRTSLYELAFEGRQERIFSIHQQMYAPLGRDYSFEHVTMRTFTPDLDSAPMTFLDFWRGPNRGYCIVQFPVGDVQLQAVLSGFDQEEAVEMMKRLVPMAGDARLFEWHASASRRLRSEIDSALGGRREQAGD